MPATFGAGLEVGRVSPTSEHEHWLAAFEGHLLRRLLSVRTLELALESSLPYLEPPALVGDSVVAALLGPVGREPETARVSVRMTPDRVLMGSCSRCTPMFGPCVQPAPG